MRNRIGQPLPLDLPPVETPPVRVYGQLIGPMQRPGAGVKILLRAISTSQIIVQDTWSECTTDSAGNYDFSLMPGKYAVFFERNGVKDRVQNIQIYSDSAPGNLQSFMLAPAPELLTPLVVLEARAILESTSAAMVRARQWAENPVDVPVLDFEQGAGPEYSAYHWAHKAQEIVDTDTNINWRGEWAAGTAYAFRDAVRWRPDANTAYSSYYCTEANSGHTPPTIAVGDNEFWSLMAAGGDKGKDGAASTVPGPAGPQGPVGPQGPKGDSGDAADMSNYYTKSEVTNLINSDLSNYYTKAQIDAMFSGGGGGVVPSGAVGAWALVNTQDLTSYSFGQSLPASDLRFVMLRLVSPGPEWVILESATHPAGTWRLAADVAAGGNPGSVMFLAQRIA